MTVPAVLFLAMYMQGRKIRRKESAMLGLEKKTVSDQDWRAIRTFSLLFVGVFVIIFIPFVLFEMALVFEEVSQTVLRRLSYVILSTHIVVDPVIIMRNGDIKVAMNMAKEEVLEFVRKCRDRKER